MARWHGWVVGKQSRKKKKGRKESGSHEENDAKWAEGSCLSMRSSWAFISEGVSVDTKINMAGL
jgi:hypothetical protein